MATYQELRTRSQQVRDEQNIGGNTALRVGQLLMDIVKYFNDNDAAASEYLQQHFAMVNDGTQLLNWQQSPIVILHTMGETYDEGDLSALSQGENYYSAGFIMEANGQGGGINGETPKANVLYVNLANDTLYTWNGSSFDAITSGGGGGSISGDDIIKNAYYSNGNLVLIIETEGGDKTVTIPVNFDASNYVPTSRTVNGKALNNNITLSQSDIPGLVAALAAKVSGIKTSDNTPLTPDSNGVVTLPPAGPTISPATASPSMDGTANVGSSDKYAREDHVHPHDTTKANASDVYTKTQADTLLSGKQNTLTFDNAPTAGSNNPVKSGGIKTALDAKANAADVPTNQDMADAIDDALGEAQVTVVPASSVGVISSLGSDSDSDALSASMGKKLKVAVLTILNSLGNYAFPGGKPTIDWGGDSSVTYSVSKTIGTGLSATGGDTDVALGDGLEVTIAVTNNLYVVDDNNVVVTMGGQPVAGAWNANTMKVTIAAVTGDVVINVPSLTYVSSGLVMNMDCKNTGGTAGHWKSIDGTYDFALTDVSVSASGAVFNGSSSKAVISNGASLNIGAGDGTVESVFTLGSPSAASPILVNSVVGNIGCACYPLSSSHWLSFRCATSASGELKYAKIRDVTKTNYAVGINTEHWYIDGMESSGAAEDGWQTIDGVTVLALGYRHRSSADNYLNGTIKCVRVYNRKLAPSEMLQNYKVDKKRFNLS